MIDDVFGCEKRKLANQRQQFVGHALVVDRPIAGGGAVKLIYIDPPYNTGSDTFGYNDRFNHSSWLTFMRSRMLVSKDLLTEDGLIFVSIDEHQRDYLKVLADEIFGRANFVGDLVRKTRTGANQNRHNFNFQHEYCLIFAKNIQQVCFRPGLKDLTGYKNPDNDPRGDWCSDNPTIFSSKQQFPIKNPYSLKEDRPPSGRGWIFDQEKLKSLISSQQLVFRKQQKDKERGFILKRYKKDLKTLQRTFNSLDFAKNDYLNQVATKQLREVIGYGASFPFPKPVGFVSKIIAATTRDKDIVLDFFAGSGTTGEAVLRQNLADGHQRRFILIEQLEDHILVCQKRLLRVLKKENLKTSFIYFELAEANQKFINQIEATNNQSKNLAIYKKIKKDAYCRYDFDPQKFEDNLEEFKNLDLKEQKEILKRILDPNQTYVPKSELADVKHGLSLTDQRLTAKFYN